MIGLMEKIEDENGAGNDLNLNYDYRFNPFISQKF